LKRRSSNSLVPFKAPGSDGLTAAFCQIAPTAPATILRRVLSKVLIDDSEIPLSDFKSDRPRSLRYVVRTHCGDEHLAHEVTLAPPRQLQCRGYWRFPRYLFEYPQVIDAIKREAESLVPVIQVSTNPGIVWQVWKKRIRSTLQRVCQGIQTEKRGLIKGG